MFDLQNLPQETNRRGFLQLAVGGSVGVFLSPNAASVLAAEPPTDGGDKKDLIVRSQEPLNSEPALEKLIQSWITPVKYFYVRNHAPTPRLDARSFRVSVEGLVEKQKSFLAGELKERFPRSSTVATMTCAGNRRNEHSAIKKVSGVQWDAGPLGNAEWGGIRLGDLLKSVGLKPAAKHVWFESVDRIEKDGQIITFGGSIPLEKAMAGSAASPEALVALEMNGKPLEPDHGFPMRTVVPGYIGARSVKWLGKIIVSDRPSPNHYLASAYKLVTEATSAEWEAADPIYHLPLNSAICTPADNAALAAGRVRIAGYALPPGLAGRTVSRVEISADGGKTWTRAKFQREAREFCWRLWHAHVPVTSATRELVVRAFDSAGQGQPKSVKWNAKGYMFNAWHKVPVKVG